MPPLIRGEYDSVVRASRDVEALRRVHEMPIDRDTARAILLTLVREFPAMWFRFGGFTTKWGRFSYTFQRAKLCPQTGKVVRPRFVTDARMTLPNGKGSALRVGVVLHEYAHLLDYSENGNLDSHGPRFTAYLDDLVAWYLASATETRLAAESRA